MKDEFEQIWNGGSTLGRRNNMCKEIAVAETAKELTERCI